MTDKTRAGPSAAAYSDVYDLMPIGIVETDLEQRIVRCNRAFAAMVGVPAEDVVSKFGWDFFHPDSPPPDPSAVADLLAGRRSSYSVDRLLCGADGSGLPVQMDWAVVPSEAGDAQVLMCAVTDVSAHARTTAELRRARERAEVLWRRAPIGIVELTPEGVITSVNPALAAMVERDPDELLGTPANQLGHPADSPAIRTTIQQLVRSGVDSSAERRYVHADGGTVPVHVSAAALKDESGEVGRVTAFVVDMSEIHAQRAALTAAVAEITLARDDLARRQLFTDTLLETMDVGIVSCDPDGTIVTRNSAERRMLDLRGQDAPAAIADVAAIIDVLDATGGQVDPEQYPMTRALRGETVTAGDFRIGPRGGPYRDVVMRGSRISTPDSTVLGAVVAITDVTDERTTLRELAAERERLNEAQRLGQIGSFSYDVATDRYAFSPELFRIWGLSPDADLAALSRRMIHPDDLARVVEHWRSASRIIGEHAIEYRIVRPDDSVRHLRVSLEVQPNAAGDPVLRQGTNLDVTELVTARTEAVQGNALFTAILAATPDFTFVTDITTGGIIYGSPGKSILGFTTEQLVEFGRGAIAGLIHPDEQQRLSADNDAARELPDGAVLELRYRARHADGSWRWLDRRITPFRLDPQTGQVREVLGVVRDVTEEHNTQLALRESEETFRAIVSQVVDYAIIGADPDGTIRSWNSGAERIKGYTAAQAVGLNISIFYTDADREDGLPARLLDTARTHGHVTNEGWRVRKDGSTCWANVNITALHDEHDRLSGFVKISKDLTAQHQLAEAQESLFSAVTHDLRNPIFAIEMFAELLAGADTEAGTDAVVQAEYLRGIQAQAGQLRNLVDGLFDYAKLRSEPTSMAREPVDVAELARTCAAAFRAVSPSRRIDVQGSDALALADRTSLTRIMDNLLGNAIKYSPTGSPIAVTIDGSAGDVIRLAVTDHGRGIAVEDLDSIFGEFNRGRLAQDGDGGTGLGLSSVRHLTEAQGGRVWIDSEEGRGTTVSVELARAPAPAGR